MGLNVSIKLIVGVPLLSLGSVKEEAREVTLTDALGKPTGESATLKEIYFVALNDTRYLIASNEQHIANGWGDVVVEYFYHQLPSHYQSNGNGGLPEQVIVGEEIETISSGPQMDRFETFTISNIKSVQDLFPKVAYWIKETFGYVGEIFVIAQAGYSR